MGFTKRLHAPIMAGEITCSVRIWQRPHVKVGGRYALGSGAVEVTALREIELADVTPELRSTYDLYFERGALIVDPGKDPDHLNIGRLAEGYAFWMVGNTRIGSASEFVSQIVAETAGQNAAEYRVRVVYNFSTVDFDGNRTAYLKFTKDDLKRLQILSEQLAPEEP